MPSSRAADRAAVRAASWVAAIQGGLGGHGVRDDDRGLDAQRPPGLQYRGDLRRVLDLPVQRLPAVGQVEAGESPRSVAQDGDAKGLEPLAGGRDVQQDFTPEQTTAIRVRPSVSRSAETSQSIAASVPRPDPRSRIPRSRPLRRDARSPRRSSRRCGRCRRRGRGPARSFATSSRVARDSNSAPSSRPIRTTRRAPQWWPGPRPRRTIASSSRAQRGDLSRRGRPWLMTVLSSATTGRPSARGGCYLRVDRHRRHAKPRPA